MAILLFDIHGGFCQISQDSVIIGNPQHKHKVSAIIIGKVLDTKGMPIKWATISINSLKIGTVSDAGGNYVLIIPTGKHEIMVRYIGVDTRIIPIHIYSNGYLNVILKEKEVLLDEIIVEGEQPDANIMRTSIGVEKLSMKDLKPLPTFLGETDVIKSLQMLPGVSSVGDGASGFNVRGGRIDQNLVMMNGVPLFNSSHLLGFFSVFNPDLTDNFTLYKGHIPARFGGRISSVLDVEMSNGNSDKLTINGGLGVFASRLSITGPVNDNKTTFIAGVRIAYPNYLLKMVQEPDVHKSTASFWDTNFGITHRFTEKQIVSVSLYGSRDSFQFSDQFGFGWKNLIANIKLNSIINPKLSSQFSAAFMDYRSESFEPTGFNAFIIENGIQHFQIKENLLLTPHDKHKTDFGFEFIDYNSLPESAKPFNDFSLFEPEKVEKGRGRELSVYLEDEFKMTSWISITGGIRYSTYQNIGNDVVFTYLEDLQKLVGNIVDTVTYENGEVIKKYKGLEPRFSARISLNNNSSIKISYNRLNQYIHLVSNTTASTPVDVWQVSDPFLKPQVADNYSAGFFLNLNNNIWETSVEGFYKDIDNLVEYKNFAELLLNEHLETELLNARGKAYGVEVYIKRTKGRWTGWLGYTYSRSKIKVPVNNLQETINNGKWYNSNYDQPHTIDLVFNHLLGRKSSFAVNFLYRRGRPISNIIANYESLNLSIAHFSERNHFRIPDYARLDLSLTIGGKIAWKYPKKDRSNSRYKGSLSISIFNILGRKNAFSVFFKVPENGFTPQAHRLSVIGAAVPALTYNFSF